MATTFDSQPVVEDFQEHVEKAGGRVDFVFGDERPFAQCHASTLTQTPGGDLLCAWFAGTEEKNPDVGIWLSRFSGGAWSAPIRAAKVQPVAHWNPVLFTAPDGAIWLFFKVGAEIPRWQTYFMKSTDDGRSWEAAQELVPGDVGGRGPVRSKPIVLSDGAWLAPSSTEQPHKNPGSWQPFADRSEDGGKTWSRSEYFAIDPAIIAGAGAIQPTLWESEPGKVHALLRTTGGVVGRTDSQDGGKTWSAVRSAGLPNNNSGIDLLKLEDGRLLLVLNPVAENWGPRNPLSLAVSEDNAETWTTLAHLEDDTKKFSGYDKLIEGEKSHAENAVGEYSYPAIVRTNKGVAICYTWRRQRIRCWQVPLEALAKA
jgi:predicted neuraminidase